MERTYFDSFGAAPVTHKGVQLRDITGSKEWNDFYSSVGSSNYKVTIISNALAGRADLISFYAYGTVEYWWLICAANEVFDPLQDLAAGKQIKIPIM